MHFMALTDAQKVAVAGMMECYADLYSSRNLQGITSLCAPEICGFGSGPDEVVDGISAMKAQIARDMSQADSIRVRFDIRRIHGEMPVAWVMADCTFEVAVHGRPLCMTGRMTAVLRNTGSRWLFTMIHFSVPAREQAAGESFPGSR